MLIRELPAATNSRARARGGGERAWHQRHQRQRWCPRPHHTARRANLDPPTRLTEDKPSRKNRPPFRGRKRTTATTLPLPPPLPPPPSAAESLERFSRHRATTTSAILSLPPAPPALYPLPPPTIPAINRHLAKRVGTTQTYKPRTTSFFRERGGQTWNRVTRKSATTCDAGQAVLIALV